MKILLIADVSIAKVIGGAERVLFEQSTRLTRRGYEVHVLTRRLERHEFDHEAIKGVREWRYEADTQKSSILFLIDTYRNGRKLFESLHNNYKFDLIIIYQPFSGMGAIRLPLGRSTIRIYNCFSFSFEEFLSRNIQPVGKLRKYIYWLNMVTRKWIEKRVLKSCDEIVVLSQFTSNKLWDAYKIPRQKVSIIPGGVDLKHFFPTDNKQTLREQFHLPSDKMILLTVRNLVSRMGVENLIHALKRIVNHSEDVYLVIGGDGPLKDELINLTKKLGMEKYICFAGFIPEAQLADYYRLADLFVLPTKELEGFGLVTLEAMASGLPVIGTPVGGTKEILGQFDDRLLFKGTDPGSIAALILENLNKIRKRPQKWQRFRQQCRHFVETHYSWEENVDALENLFLRQMK